MWLWVFYALKKKPRVTIDFGLCKAKKVPILKSPPSIQRTNRENPQQMETTQTTINPTYRGKSNHPTGKIFAQETHQSIKKRPISNQTEPIQTDGAWQKIINFPIEATRTTRKPKINKKRNEQMGEFKANEIPQALTKKPSRIKSEEREPTQPGATIRQVYQTLILKTGTKRRRRDIPRRQGQRRPHRELNETQLNNSRECIGYNWFLRTSLYANAVARISIQKRFIDYGTSDMERQKCMRKKKKGSAKGWSSRANERTRKQTISYSKKTKMKKSDGSLPTQRIPSTLQTEAIQPFS